jgi:hypothetical protein
MVSSTAAGSGGLTVCSHPESNTNAKTANKEVKDFIANPLVLPFGTSDYHAITELSFDNCFSEASTSYGSKVTS